MRKIERNNSADTRVIEEGREEGAPGARAEVPQQPMEKTMLMQIVPLHTMVVYSGAETLVVRLSPGTKKEPGESALMFVLISHYSILICLAID